MPIRRPLLTEGLALNPTLLPGLLVASGGYWTFIPLPPAAHAASHTAAGSDPLTLTQAQITGLAAALAALEPAFTTLPVSKGGTGTSTPQTLGRVWFTGASGVLTTDAKLFWDNVNKYLGIGGSGTPTTQIDIQSGAGTNANFRVRGNGQSIAAGQHFLDVFSGVSGHGLYGYGAKDMIFGVNAITKLTLAQAGAAHEIQQSGVTGVLKVRNVSNNGYSFVDLHDDANVKVGGFGYANSGTPAATASKTYFYTVGKDFYVSTDNGATQHFKVAATTGDIALPKTVTAPGTTTVQTINKPMGRVNVAAGGASIAVTNSLVTANSIIVATCATNDATAQVMSVVAGAGTFTIHLVACTAETAINWIVLN